MNDLRALLVLSLYTSAASVLSLDPATNTSTPEYGSEITMETAMKVAGAMNLEREIQVVIDFRRATTPTLLRAPAPQSLLGSVEKCRLVR